MGDDDDPPRSLPDDVVQDEVLGRLPRGALAVCRCVCKAWRDAIDSRGMLRPDLLPLGIFFNLDFQPAPPLLFAPPSMGRKVVSDLKSLVKTGIDPQSCLPFMSVIDCCNGLLLADVYVVNPATGQCQELPPCPAPEDDDYDVHHILFDPRVSPHYQVLTFKQLYGACASGILEDGSAEWPPSPYMMWVYSSETRRWEETPFVREGPPAGTLAEARSAEDLPDYHRAVYCHGALYAKCTGPFIMRITLSNCKYQVIKLPEDVCAGLRPYIDLVKSKCGVYVAIVCELRNLRVWLLDESSGRAEWMLKYNINLQAVHAQFPRNRAEYPIDRPWIIHGKGINGKVYGNRHSEEEDEFEWDFDKNNMLEIELKDEEYHRPGVITMLGFHPHKEVAFLNISDTRVVAFHLDGSKVQDLGPFDNPYWTNYGEPTAYFVYTPCWMPASIDD